MADRTLIPQYKPLGDVITKPKKEINTESIRYTPEGFIDTRVFKKAPQWTLEYNRNKEISLTKEYEKYPEGVLGKIVKQISRFEAYETYRDIRIKPEEYKSPLKILQRYIQEVKKPEVSWRLKGYHRLFRRYTPEFSPLAFARKYRKLSKEEEEIATKAWEEKYKGKPFGVSKIKSLWADMDKGEKQKTVEALNEYYRLTDIDKKVKLGELKDEHIIDWDTIAGLAIEMSPANPSNIIFMGIGKLAKKAIQPVQASLMQKGMKTTLGSAANKIFRKVYVSKTINQLGDEGVTAMKRILARSDDIVEAETKFLNIYRPGWQGMVGAPKEITKLPSLLDQFIEKVSKRPTGQKALEYFHKKFRRGYGDMLRKDFTSRIKSLGIKQGSWEDIMVRNILNSKYPESYMKNLMGLTDEMTEAYNMARKYNKQILEIENMLGTPYSINEVQGYLFRKYVETPGKPIAYNIGREIGIDKPIVAYNRTFKTIEEARKAGYIVADGFIEPMVGRLQIHAGIQARQGYMQALKETYGTSYVRGELGELAEKGLRKVKGVKELKGYVFDDKLATIIERQKDVINLGKVGNTLIQFNKKIMNPIKKIWTFTTGFHLRNLYGSHFQNATEYGWTAVMNPLKQTQAAKLAWTADDFAVRIGNKSYKSSAVRDLFDISGLGAGWYKGELVSGQRFLGKMWQKTMGKAGDLTERQVRMFSLVEGLDETGNFIDACLITKLLHFDYLDGLAMAEKVYGRAAVPFYTWKRFNAPLQAYFLGTKTTRVANTFRTVRTMGVGDPAKIPTWFNQYIMGKIGSLDATTNVQKYLKLDIPLAQIGLLQPIYEALTEKGLTMRERWLMFLSPFVSQSNPFIKFWFEILTGFDTFRLAEIPSYKVASAIPDFILESFPDILLNIIEAEQDKDGIWRINAEWNKVAEQIPGLYQLAVSAGYGKYPEYKKQKWAYDQLSMIGGVKIYPVDEKYYSPLVKRQIKKRQERIKEYEKKQEKLQEMREPEKKVESKSYLRQLIKKWQPLGE